MDDAPQPSKRFIDSPVVQVAAFVWGFSEATLFFVVPDVLLSVIGCRSIRVSLRASRNALFGALLGGLLMYILGRHSPELGRKLLVQVPAVHQQLITQVQSQFAQYQIGALLIGPLTGIPYKIYAIEWGSNGGSLLLFLLVSIPARGIRFLLSGLLAGGLARAAAPWTKRRALVELVICVLFWLGFYTVYFRHFGW